VLREGMLLTDVSKDVLQLSSVEQASSAQQSAVSARDMG
jgi:hypothetical protein